MLNYMRAWINLDIARRINRFARLYCEDMERQVPCIMKRLLALVICAMLCSGCAFLHKKDTQVTSGDNPLVKIEMENGGVINLELYPDIAPTSVANFVTLAESGYYDGLIFHRVIARFMIQGGDPTGTGMGGPGYSIKGEFSANGFNNELKHERGVISMARSQSPDSAGSQFFIMHADYPSLDGNYAAFGRVQDDESLKVVDQIAATSTDGSDRPLTEQKIKSITVDTNGVTYTFDKITD